VGGGRGGGAITEREGGALILAPRFDNGRMMRRQGGTMLIRTESHWPTGAPLPTISATDVATGRRIERPYRYDLWPAERHLVVAAELAGDVGAAARASGSSRVREVGEHLFETTN
jgi:hypothetical protein